MLPGRPQVEAGADAEQAQGDGGAGQQGQAIVDHPGQGPAAQAIENAGQAGDDQGIGEKALDLLLQGQIAPGGAMTIEDEDAQGIDHGHEDCRQQGGERHALIAIKRGNGREAGKGVEAYRALEQ